MDGNVIAPKNSSMTSEQKGEMTEMISKAIQENNRHWTKMIEEQELKQQELFHEMITENNKLRQEDDRMKVENEKLEHELAQLQIERERSVASYSNYDKEAFFSDVGMRSLSGSGSGSESVSQDINEMESDAGFNVVTKKSLKRKSKKFLDCSSTKKTVKEDFPKLPKTTNTKLSNFLQAKIATSTNVTADKPAAVASGSGSQPLVESGNARTPPKDVKRLSSKVPPIVLRDKSQYDGVALYCKNNKLTFGKAQVTREGVRMYPDTLYDYRSITKLLETREIPFHSYRFPEEKMLHVNIRGVLESWTPDKVMKDLFDASFHPEKVHQWGSKEGMPLPMVLALIPKSEKSIFDLRYLDGLRVRVESQKAKTRDTQCFRCQIFGHSQGKCTAPPRCVKCAGPYLSWECSKGKVASPRCANCGGGHTASSKDCSLHPLNVRARREEAKLVVQPPSRVVWGSQPSVSALTSKKPASQAAVPVVAQLDPASVPQLVNTVTNLYTTLQNFLRQFTETIHPQLAALEPIMRSAANCGSR